MSESRRLRSEVFADGMTYSVKENKASSRAATLKRILGTELPCELLLVGGLPLFCCPPALGTDVVVGVILITVCVGMAEGVGDGVGTIVGVDVGVDIGVTGVSVGVIVQLQEILTEFAGPVKTIVSFAGQVVLEGIVMFTETFPLG